MKIQFIAIILFICSLAVHAQELPDNALAYSHAMRHSDFVFLCEVKDERAGGQTPLGYFKSFFVSHPESLYFGLEGLEIPSEIWIVYDSSKYPDVPEGENAMAFHKGDTFIAFLDLTNEFHVVRIDKVENKDAIRKAIQEHTEQSVPGYPPQGVGSPDP